MEKLYKIGRWLLANKERMVLIALVAVLCFKVYNVVVKKEEDPTKTNTQVYKPPMPNPPADWFDGPNAPKDPPPPPPLPPETPFQGLARANPFTVYGYNPTVDGPKEEAPEDISLVMIRPWPDGTMRAGIKTRVMRYYKEGEAFESYQVLKIDPAGGTVEVYSNRLGKSITLTLVQPR